ncbi:M1 family aminopeptidase [Flavobacterium sp. Fl-77]|uniref:Aminopeptidase N n=1 Tax=Flavobacterium flavipigmentatum TaxID=2893884 RepID=A0AAJ2S7A4_9FLAO|nr:MULTISPECIES: M1 family aminopeptidase [unclassified Flavobacterium]MDX6181246.1 M1 family aminopeptidase [Flavobacterium sp. Fl-33]MDX6184847.1 M1 family aminopeptidase [Flavobacterium sp. Fl-77]UFH39939.1 M1 family aminopeptidase [Flavobacterium sp. F-70]
MKMISCFLSFFTAIVFGFSQSKQKQSILLEKGVSQELAIFRKKQLRNVVYALSFVIPNKKDEEIASNLVLNLSVSDLSNPLYLDFNEKSQNIKSVKINGKNSAIVHEKEHIIIPTENLILGPNKVEIAFIAGNLSLNRNDDYLYTLLVPDRASTVFPCLDQPDIKATYKLRFTVPKDWSVLAGADVKERMETENTVTYTFGESDKMSSYLFSFVAGKFKSITQNPGMEMTMLYRENNPEKIQVSTDTIFKLHQQSLDFLEKYTHYKFPFQKLDFAAIPGFQYGGMEHVGAIQYRESTLFLDNSATDSEKLDRAKLIAHETSHMWFGDLVTMKWFDDVWMKEVFANFMADKIMNPIFPKINHNLQFLTAHYPNAYAEDRSLGTHPIKQNLANLKNAGSLYGSIIYNKAPIMMRQLEASMGEAAFQKGIQKYIQKFANDNADWNNLVSILDAETPLDMQKWSEVWVNKSGRAIFTDKIEYDAQNRIKKFEILQKAEDKSGNVWPQIFDITLLYPNEIKTIKVNLKEQKVNLAAAVGLMKPLAIIYNSNGFGYGVFPLDGNHLEYILTVKDEVARGSAYLNLYENMLIGTVAPTAAFDCFMMGIEAEQNELVLKLLTNQANVVFWKLLTERQQIMAQKQLEDILYERLQTTLPSNIKKTLFNLFSSIAYSDSAKAKLYQIWRKEVVIQNLKLNEDDYTNIAMNLAIFKHEKAAEILNAAKTVITNLDKQRRFNFLLPSLSQEESVRDAFMESLKEDKNREKESWVGVGLANFHHPLRQESAKKYLKFSLDLVEEIQRTGDIFFPKDWLNNTIGKYASKEAFEVVQTFLKENPNFSPILKRKLWQATDALYRAQNIKKETE